ncbi:runt-related transcription factor 1 [Caerostris extrusa]|uniref:Runt-related transcription factor 1 n=1 Tax=Caerostris extrusa TaxID=172846 RepID=A0AAV4NSC3_CAEEX|nr:runt-related transcription factor 1 [Caerostris extrusa]
MLCNPDIKYKSDPGQLRFRQRGPVEPHSAAHYQNYLGHGLQQAAGFAPCPQMDLAPARDSGHATPQTTPTGILPDHHSSSSSQAFPILNDQQPSPSSIKDSLFVTRYNNAMVAASELCLTDRLTELRHGLSGTNPNACSTYPTNHPFNNASLAFLAAGSTPHNPNLPYFALYSSQNQIHSSMQLMNNGDTRSSTEEETVGAQRCLDRPSISEILVPATPYYSPNAAAITVLRMSEEV